MVGMKQKVAGVKTRNGKPLWKSEDDYEPYSEKTQTFEYGDGYIVTPTIDPETGGPYKLDDLLQKYEQDGPYDLYTGEKLPVFEDVKTADDYARWRSDNILNFDLTDQEFFTGESGMYSKQDGSEVTFADRKQDMIDYAAEARDDVYGFLGIPTDEEQGSGMALGGLAVSRKGIKTTEGEDMANKKFQLDEGNADLDSDGNLSAYEKQRGEAVQKAMVDDPEQDEKTGMYHGGMMGPVDPVSGNPIPVGSTAEEVRDDIDVMLSQGEYVLPADVVKWHGLKHIMDMQQEAKMGLMTMDSMGLIQTGDEEASAEDMCPICMDAECDGCEEESSEEDIVETPEGEEVEMASMEVSLEEPEVNETEDYKDSDYSKKTSMFGMVKKPKVTFIV